MGHVFRNKKLAILTVAAIMIVLLLACMLLATLTQMTALNQRAEMLKAQIKQLCDKEVELKDLLEFMKTDEYVKLWAENNGRMSSDDIRWIANQVSGK